MSTKLSGDKEEQDTAFTTVVSLASWHPSYSCCAVSVSWILAGGHAYLDNTNSSSCSCFTILLLYCLGECCIVQQQAHQPLHT